MFPCQNEKIYLFVVIGPAKCLKIGKIIAILMQNNVSEWRICIPFIQSN